MIVSQLREIYESGIKNFLSSDNLPEFLSEKKPEERDAELLRVTKDLMPSLAREIWGEEKITVRAGEFIGSFWPEMLPDILSQFEAIKPSRPTQSRRGNMPNCEYAPNLRTPEGNIRNKEAVLKEVREYAASVKENIETANRLKQPKLSELWAKHLYGVETELNRIEGTDFEDLQYKQDFTKYEREISTVFNREMDLLRELRFYSPDRLYCDARKNNLGDLVIHDPVLAAVKIYATKTGRHEVEEQIKRLEEKIAPMLKKDGRPKSMTQRQRSIYEMNENELRQLRRILAIYPENNQQAAVEIVPEITPEPQTEVNATPEIAPEPEVKIEPEATPEPEITPEPLPEKKPLNKILVVRYSNYSFAFFGETFPAKDTFKDHGAKFNRFLKHEGKNTPGWITTVPQGIEIMNELELQQPK